MPKPTDTGPDLSTFAGRKAAREAREAVDGPPERRQVGGFKAGYDAEQIPAGTVVRRVQA